MDWDGDGSLDVWTASRTAPQIRFLHNRCPAPGRWIRLHLEGVRSNRDAVGARVEIRLPGQPVLARAVRAGEGFLSQSTRWLHAGLGPAETVAELTVRWPSGLRQVFRDIAANRSYLIREGDAECPEAAAPVPARPEAEELQTGLPDAAGGRLFLHHRVTLPPLPYADASGAPRSAALPPAGEGLLAILWAAWCVPCRDELQILAEQAPALRKDGLRILALHPPGTPGQAERDFLRKISFPHDAGEAAPVTADLFHQVIENTLGMRKDLPVPCALLIGPGGAVHAVYLGSAPLETVLQDLQVSRGTAEERLAAAAPFPGRWIRPENPAFHSLFVPVTLLRHGLIAEAAAFARRHEADLLPSPNYPLVLGGMAERLARDGASAEAVHWYRRSLQLAPDNPDVMNNLAWILATHPDPAVRNGEEAVLWARRAAEEPGGPAPGRLDTLAAALAESGDFEAAVRTAQEGLRRARELGDDAAAEHLQAAQERYQARRPTRQRVQSEND